MSDSLELNTRVLVIDDEESVRDSFKQALCPEVRRHEGLAQAAALLFGDEPPPAPSAYAGITFQVDFARSGREGFALAEKAVSDGRPYAVVFTDMRMPGWDGLETATRIRVLDQRCEIIFVTAYSDYAVDSMIASVGTNVGYFLKPFAIDELKQMAAKAVLDWNKAREMERFLHTLGSLEGEVHDIETLLGYLLGELCLWLGTRSGALAQLSGQGELRFRLGRGSLSSQEALDELVGNVAKELARNLPGLDSDEPVLHESFILLPIQKFGVAVALKGSAMLTPERLYLLRAFLKHASLAIRNSEARAQLMQSRRLTAMGEALGYVVHDLRGPLGNVQNLLEYLRSNGAIRFSSQEIHELIDMCLHQATALVNDTLDLVRGTAHVSKQPEVLASALARPLTLLGLELEQRGIPLVLAIPPDLTAHIDAMPLFRVLRNLAVNAAEALRGRKERRVEIGASARPGVDGSGVCIWVADNGPGIPDSVRAHLFTPFATSGKPGGTGLGLAVVKLIVEAHGGTIEVHTGPEGTRFELLLP